VRILRVDGAVLMFVAGILLLSGHGNIGRWPLDLGIALIVAAALLDYSKPPGSSR
jgi:hypothetical protein